MKDVRIAVRSLDPLTTAGLASRLGSWPELTVVPQAQPDAVDVIVMAIDQFSAQSVGLLRKTANEIGKPIVLITNEIKEVELVLAVECRVVAIISRAAATTGDRLAQCIHSAAGMGANLPPNLLGTLLAHTERLHDEVLASHGISPSGLTAREIDVLRLMADGSDTAEIAATLNYSERTVKNIIYSITNRLHLRNRPQAVAYAIRAGVI
jgi:DNA-binding NarL/FixJ family response regulator